MDASFGDIGLSITSKPLGKVQVCVLILFSYFDKF
jgi:hypothetical protein